MAKTLRFGIAGLGAASGQILPYFGKIPNVTLTAAADIRQEARDAARAKYGVETFDSVKALCESPNVDAVWIATPNALHAEHAIVAAENGKHIICEKPTAVTLEECDRMIAAAERNRVKFLQGHSKIYDAPVRKIREVVASGELGRLIQINTWNYNDWLQRPRTASEVDTSQGGGIVYRQGPHQTDIVRCIGGGMVRSLRAVAGRRDPHFNTEGDFTAFLEFEDGTPATMAFNGYGYFNIVELTWGIGEGGRQIPESEYLSPRRPRLTGPVDQKTKSENPRTEQRERLEKKGQPFFGLTVVSCERGVIRQSPDGLYIYTEEGRREIPCGASYGRAAELLELYEGVTQDRPIFPDGRWGKASLEVVLTILQSSRERREITLSHQVPCPI
jgi:phthalate 4,5-cis-dihydrodiol dehydrogenase